MLPALIDIDSFFHQDTIVQHAETCLKSGISRIFDGRGKSPKTLATMTIPELVGPLSIFHYIDGSLIDEYDFIGKAKKQCIGVKAIIELTSSPISTQRLAALDRLFQIAAQENLIVTVSLAQGNGSLKEQRDLAITTIVQAITLAEKYSNQLCLQHLRTAEELVLVKEAKENGILVYAEIAYPHLFISERDIRGERKSAHFLPNIQDQDALWNGLNDGTIDMIGSGNLLTPPELLLPLLIGATKTKGLRLEKLVAITRLNIESIFRLPPNKDIILVDLEKNEPFPLNLIEEHLLSPEFKNLKLNGWTQYMIAHEELIPTS